MNFKLIPTEDRNKYRCCVCGETRSVKYLMPTIVIDTLSGIEELPYCNRCALLHSALIEKNKGEQK